jgi:hypothetical protein
VRLEFAEFLELQPLLEKERCFKIDESCDNRALFSKLSELKDPNFQPALLEGCKGDYIIKDRPSKSHNFLCIPRVQTVLLWKVDKKFPFQAERLFSND